MMENLLSGNNSGLKRASSLRRSLRKLRKREEHSNSVHPADVVLHQTTNPGMMQLQPQTVVTVSTANNQNSIVTANSVNAANNQEPLAYRGAFLWQYPPPPPQPCLYNNNQESLVQNLTTEQRPGFVRGFRKNLGGRWRRLVKRKPETEVYKIPAELKPQLKQIYVY